MSISNANCLIANGARVDETGYSEGTPLQLAKQLFSDKQYEDFVTQIRHHQPNLSVSRFFCFCDFFFFNEFYDKQDNVFKLEPYNYDTLSDDVKELAKKADIDPVTINRNFATFQKTFNLLYPDKLKCPPRKYIIINTKDKDF